MNEEEKKQLKVFIDKLHKYDESVEIKGISIGEEYRILNTVEKAINLLENQSKMIDLMIEDMPTSDYHSKEWVKDYYEKKASEEEWKI